MGHAQKRPRTALCQPGLQWWLGKYNAATGAAINANFITGLSSPKGLALSGNHLFVTNFLSNTIGEYNATTGAWINANLITGLDGPLALALSGNNLFVTDFFSNTIGEYSATTGATLDERLTNLRETLELLPEVRQATKSDIQSRGLG